MDRLCIGYLATVSGQLSRWVKLEARKKRRPDDKRIETGIQAVKVDLMGSVAQFVHDLTQLS